MLDFDVVLAAMDRERKRVATLAEMHAEAVAKGDGVAMDVIERAVGDPKFPSIAEVTVRIAGERGNAGGRVPR